MFYADAIILRNRSFAGVLPLWADSEGLTMTSCGEALCGSFPLLSAAVVNNYVFTLNVHLFLIYSAYYMTLKNITDIKFKPSSWTDFMRK